VDVVGPIDRNDGDFSEFALRLRDVAASALSNTRAFWTKVAIEDIHLEGPVADPSLVILLRVKEHPGAVYGLRAKVSGYDPEEGDPESWSGYIHDEVMAAVDAAPGLPAPTGAVTWIDLCPAVAS
jgi:hypothetical protein